MSSRRRFLATFLGGAVVMTIPGAGGQQERPFNAPAGQATPVGVQPGTQAGITFARALVVFGPSGAVVGAFVYQAGTTPKAGNGPVLSGTEASKDPYGNAVQQGWVSYSSPGSPAYAALSQGELAINSTGTQNSPALFAASGAGGAQVNSGTIAPSDTAAVVRVLSAQNPSASGGQPTVQLVAPTVQLTTGASANIPVSSAGITTVPQLVAALVSAGVLS